MSIAEDIGREVKGWPGVEAKAHRYNGVEFRVNGHEIGHLHGSRLADLPFPVRMRKELVATGKAQSHHVLPETGWVSYPIRGEEDAEGALELFRLNYERLTARHRGTLSRRGPKRDGGGGIISAFTEKEIGYLREGRLGRLATVNGKGEPHVVPVAFRYNDELDAIDIGGHNFARSKKYRDAKVTGRAAFVVDDVLPPWRARGVEVRGRAEISGEGGEEIGPGFDADVIRIFPERIVEWGLESDAYRPNSRSVGGEGA